MTGARIIGPGVRPAARATPKSPAPTPARRDRAAPSVTGVTPRPQVQHLQVDDESAGQRLDNYLVRLLKGVPKTHLYRVIRSGEVRVNKARASADTRVQRGDDVRVPPMRLAQRPAAGAVPPREFAVAFEDEWLLAVDKPAGVAVHGGSGVSFGVIEQLRRARPEAKFLELVHRLDRDTSGLLLVAKKRSALNALQQQFRDRETGKVYAALVVGAWPKACKVIDLPLHKYLLGDGERRVRIGSDDDAQSRRSITLIRSVRPAGPCSLLEVAIKTGRTHQIRVHLAHIGHGIVGDDKYGDFDFNKRIARGELIDGLRFDGMFLHAQQLSFDHPASGERIELHAPLPIDRAALLAALGAA
jgi:23S rRNA pseudouridine955/2504/2580 synthase